MDLLFSRYASPFELLNQMIGMGSFSRFIDEFGEIRRREKEDRTEWEYFLHKVFGKSFNEFQEELREERSSRPDPAYTKKYVETTVNRSRGILKKFKNL